MAGQAERTLRPEDEISHYRIVAPLGAGGMGEVYLAQDRTLERNVALKILPPDLVRSEDRVRRFVLEAKSASSLSHPNIVTIYEIGQDAVRSPGSPDSDPVHFISMELVSGKTLSSAHPRGQGRPAHAPRLPRAGRGGARQGPRGRHRAPRPQAREHHGLGRRLREGARLRPRQAHREARGGAGHLRGPDPRRRRQRASAAWSGRPGYMSPEQVAGRGRRPPLRHLLVRLHPLRGGHPAEAVRRRDRRRDDAQDPQREARPGRGAQRQGPGRAAAPHPALPRQEPRPARPVDEGPGDRAARDRGRVRHALGVRELREPRVGCRRRGEAGAHRGLPALVAAGLLAAVGLAVGWWGLRRGASEGGKPPAFQSMRMSTQTSRGDVIDTRDLARRPLPRLPGRRGRAAPACACGRSRPGATSRCCPRRDATLESPSFSPDGNYLFYLTRKPENPNYRALFQVPSLGGTPQERAFDVDSRVTFSPDGKKIAFWRGVPQKREVPARRLRPRGLEGASAGHGREPRGLPGPAGLVSRRHDDRGVPAQAGARPPDDGRLLRRGERAAGGTSSRSRGRSSRASPGCPTAAASWRPGRTCGARSTTRCS